MKKLNLGCGKDVKKGYINLDYKKLTGVDVSHDINKTPYPFKNDEFDEIYASHVLEHVDNLEKVMKELHRIIKKGGFLHIRVPHFTNSGAFADPTHKHFFAYRTFDYFMNNLNENWYFDFQFSKLEKNIVFGKKFAFWNWILEPIFNLVPIIYEDTFLRVFPAQELVVKIYK
jgi:predicted SAM-dependent methyltransferase